MTFIATNEHYFENPYNFLKQTVLQKNPNPMPLSCSPLHFAAVTFIEIQLEMLYRHFQKIYTLAHLIFGKIFKKEYEKDRFSKIKCANGALFSLKNQKVHFHPFPSTEFLPAISQFTVP